MKVEKCNEAGCSVELNVVLDADETKSVREKAVKAVGARAAMPGFRKGKVPRAMLEKSFPNEIAERTANAAIGENLEKAVEEAGLKDRVYRVEDVKDYSGKPGETISFTCALELKPVFKTPDVSKLKLEKKPEPVTDEDVANYIEDLRKRSAKYEAAKPEDVAEEDDYAAIDYKGEIDGRPVTEIAPDAKALASGANFWIAIKEGSFVPEILEALKGMKTGETKKVEVTFPGGEPVPEAIRSMKAQYEVKLSQLRKAAPPDDAELAERWGNKTFDELKEMVRTNIETRREQADNERLHNEAIEFLLKGAEFEVPKSRVLNERNAYLQRLEARAQESGLPSDYFEKNKDKIAADAEAAAVRQVRLSFILLALADEMKIETPQNALGAEVSGIAERSGLSFEKAFQRLRDNGNLKILSEGLRAQSALDKIVANALAG